MSEEKEVSKINQDNTLKKKKIMMIHQKTKTNKK